MMLPTAAIDADCVRFDAENRGHGAYVVNEVLAGRADHQQYERD
jgi:hypothetical protein